MPTNPDNHLIVNNRYIPSIRLVDRLMDILGITDPDDRKAFAKSHLVTAGFTIAQVGQVLPSSPPMGTPLNSPRLLGWLFMLPKMQTNAPNDALMSKIKVKTLVMATTSGNIVMSGNNPLLLNNDPVQILPKIFYQKNPSLPPAAYNSTYPVSFDHVEPQYVDDPELHVSRLESYEAWAELAMYGRGDLDLMKAYFDAGLNAYNDIFFSGARVNYRIMHNPKLRVQQKTFVSPVTGFSVPGTSSNAFTLKAEPYILTNDNLGKGNEAPPILGPGATTEKSAVETVAAPMVALMDPCPDYWDLIGGISTAAAYATTSISPEAQLQIASALLSLPPAQLIDAKTSAPLVLPNVKIQTRGKENDGCWGWFYNKLGFGGKSAKDEKATKSE